MFTYVKFHVLGAAITASVLPSDGGMTVKTVESVEIGFRSRWTSVEVVNSRDGHRSMWFRSKWKSVEVTYNPTDITKHFGTNFVILNIF